MKLGMVGLPNVGKSTLFNALTNAGAESANYPFCTIEPNVGIVSVPDERLLKLKEMCADASFITLEVRESNNAAIRLYEKLGYKEVGRRKNFYSDPTENAILMTMFFNGDV